jgi:hypothetical protein
MLSYWYVTFVLFSRATDEVNTLGASTGEAMRERPYSPLPVRPFREGRSTTTSGKESGSPVATRQSCGSS